MSVRVLRSGAIPSSTSAALDPAYPLADSSATTAKRDSPPMNTVTTRLRASSDPLSRGGAFTDDGPNSHLLAHEPNPFEQSFSGPPPSSGVNYHHDPSRSREPTVNPVASGSSLPRRARSNSPPAVRTPGGLQKLPPLSLIQTPSTELANFGWGVDSLRTGPLSPALLNGPTSQAPATSLYDPSNLRTGLTPLASGVSFPPPSPATAALFAMMTNNTPGTADPAALGLAGGGPRPHEGPNERDHFDASFAQATATNDPKARRGSEVTEQAPYQMHGGQPVMPQGNQRVHLSSAINGQPPRSIAPQVMHPSQIANQPHPYSVAGAPPPVYPMDPHQYQQLSAQHQQMHQQHPHPQAQFPGGASGGPNPLYLLSQAQDLNHNDDAVVAAAALSNLGGPGGYPPNDQMPNAAMNGVMPGAVGGAVNPPVAPQPSVMNTRGRMASPASTNGSSAAAKGKRAAATAAATNKRKKAEEEKKPPAKKGRKAKAEPDEDDDSDDEDAKSPAAPPNPNETEEEKRKNFLERNRQAALKCRQRKKAWLANLQSKVELLSADNDTLQSTVTNLKDEVSSLRAILAAHANCPVAISNADRRGPAAYPQQQAQRF
ncbi:hypothetical protein MNV49_000154 [Pseudohyphozyma bogoriensis]|nr:hypothetical protein MNV49_000154 [Pseudohyphozyma bogoriensis]